VENPLTAIEANGPRFPLEKLAGLIGLHSQRLQEDWKAFNKKS
jgi:hypothetical protein